MYRVPQLLQRVTEDGKTVYGVYLGYSIWTDPSFKDAVLRVQPTSIVELKDGELIFSKISMDAWGPIYIKSLSNRIFPGTIPIPELSYFDTLFIEPVFHKDCNDDMHMEAKANKEIITEYLKNLDIEREIRDFLAS